MEEITLDANKITLDLASLTVAAGTTGDGVLQARVHRLGAPVAVLIDEANKMSEIAAIATLIYSREYSHGAGPLTIDARVGRRREGRVDC